MKAYRGFLLTEDGDTKKMVPFFVKARTNDMVCEPFVDIDKIFTQTSTRWTMFEPVATADNTCYMFQYIYDNRDGTGDPDPYNEDIPHAMIQAMLTYDFHRDGRLHIHCDARVSGEEIDVDPSVFVSSFKKTINLPYAIDTWWVSEIGEDSDMSLIMKAGTKYGEFGSISTAAVLNATQITSQYLNKNSVDTRLYPYQVNIFQTETDNTGAAFMRNFIDTFAGPQYTSDHTYMKEAVPIYFDIDWFWDPDRFMCS